MEAAATFYPTRYRRAGTDQSNIVQLCILPENNEAGSIPSWSHSFLHSVRRQSWSGDNRAGRGSQSFL
ncbi:hypothetical protein V5799_021835 [Amblyomma americanum]|uniref:Uncharacterized protein n=1 Tax=Amblyomma americanum TaxID=6943 RepID=A0AAQ4FP73_AMBAM